MQLQISKNYMPFKFDVKQFTPKRDADTALRDWNRNLFNGAYKINSAYEYEIVEEDYFRVPEVDIITRGEFNDVDALKAFFKETFLSNVSHVYQDELATQLNSFMHQAGLPHLAQTTIMERMVQVAQTKSFPYSPLQASWATTFNVTASGLIVEEQCSFNRLYSIRDQEAVEKEDGFCDVLCRTELIFNGSDILYHPLGMDLTVRDPEFVALFDKKTLSERFVSFLKELVGSEKVRDPSSWWKR